MKFITQATLTTIAFVGLMAAGIELATADATLNVEQQLSRAFKDAKKHKKQKTRFTIYSNKPIRKATLSRSLRLVMDGARPNYKGLGLKYTDDQLVFGFLYQYPNSANKSLHKWTIDVEPLEKTEIEKRTH